MKKLITIIVSLCVFALMLLLAAYSVDHHMMKNNKPVVFSTWGVKYAPPAEEKGSHSFMGEILDETTGYMIVKPIVVFKSDDIHIPKGAENKLKIEYNFDHYDYLYGIGRRVVIYYDGVPYTDENGVITIKTDDISTEGYRDFKLNVRLSDEKIKRQIVKRTPPTDSSGKWWTYGDAALYYYGIEDVMITIQGWSSPLKAALEKGTITLDAIIAKCNGDVRDGVIEEISYDDGGSQVYKYPDYTIIKYHTLDGNRDVYIGSSDMDIKIAYLMIN